MKNPITRHRRWKLTTAILSLSLLTVMAGAAVAPALNLIAEYFRGTDPMFVQLIISMPALFIALTNLFFQKLTRIFRARTLLMIGLVLYVAGGCIAGIFSNIFLILLCRAVVGIGVGIIMPLSTGLISFYFTRDKQDVLMGYSSALNMGGGVVATLIAGVLAAFSWRLSFLVYLLGLISIVLCMMWMPNESIYDSHRSNKAHAEGSGVFRRNYPFIIGMFFLMVAFFIYPANFAIETAKQAVIDQRYVAVIMALMDVFGFFGGLAYVHLRKVFKTSTRFLAPILFLAGYALLQFFPGWGGTLIGSFLIGFANGVGVPLIISTASKREGSRAAATVMPLISMALYLAQFTTPFIAGAAGAVLETLFPGCTSYTVGMLAAVCFLAWSVTIPLTNEPDRKPKIRQESRQK